MAKRERERQVHRAAVPSATAGDAAAAPPHERIALLAYELWQQRGCPIGSPEQDWEEAQRTLAVAPSQP